MKKGSSDTLKKFMAMPNIAEDKSFTLEKLSKISAKALSGYEIDVESQAEWLFKTEVAIDLAALKKTTTSFPWKDAANVKFPLITTAALQSGARMYPEIVRNGKVVGAAVIGADPDGSKQLQADRVVKYMNYQLLDESDDWEPGTDKLVHVLPVVGTLFRKTYFNPVCGYNEYEVCFPHEVVINNKSKSLEKAPRVNHIFRMSYNQIVENIRAGLYTEYTIEELGGSLETVEDYEEAYPEILEQHGFLDLDEDGYEEPYITTIHKRSGKVLRIVARFDVDGISYNKDKEIVTIEPIHYFTDYHFIPSPDGSFYSLGFGQLLMPLNETANTLVNQLLNAGSLASLQGGILGGGLKLKGGEMPIRPGEWRHTDTLGMDISRNIVPINYKEPSPVLFQLLGFLVEHTDKLTSITDALTGNEHTQNSPATSVTSMIDQGLKVFTSIMRRLYRSFQKEYAKIYRLNGLFVDPNHYMQVLGEQVPMTKGPDGSPQLADFDGSTFKVIPISDPNVSSDVLRGAQNQLLLQLLANPQVGMKLNADDILRRVLEASNIPAIEKVLLPPDQQQKPPADPNLMKVQIEGTVQQSEMHMKEQQLQIDMEQHKADMAQAAAQLKDTQADAVLKLAQANGIAQDAKFQALEIQVGILKEQNKQVLAHIKGLHSQATTAMNNESDQAMARQKQDDGGDTGDVAAAPDNSGTAPVPDSQYGESGESPPSQPAGS
jgi:chaperonin GroES